MNLKKVTLAALAGSALLAAAPAFADGNRGDRQFQRGDQFQHQSRGDRFQRRYYVNNHGPRHYYYGQRRVIVQQPMMVHRPVAVYHDANSHNVLRGLILGSIIGVAIASHAGR